MALAAQHTKDFSNWLSLLTIFLGLCFLLTAIFYIQALVACQKKSNDLAETSKKLSDATKIVNEFNEIEAKRIKINQLNQPTATIVNTHGQIISETTVAYHS